jgi:hypothetical protein
VAGCTSPQHGVELGFGDSEQVRCQSPRSAGGGWAWYRPDMVNSAVAHFTLDSGWAGELRELSEEAVDRSAASDCLHAWDL